MCQNSLDFFRFDAILTNLKDIITKLVLLYCVFFLGQNLNCYLIVYTYIYIFDLNLFLHSFMLLLLFVMISVLSCFSQT